MKLRTNFMNEQEKRILLVEDNVAEAQSLATFLESQGWLVVVAPTVKEALAQEPPFTVVLCDVYLGEGGSGIEGGRMLQERLKVPVVFMSGRSDSQTLDEALSVSPYGYLVKPFGLAEMLTTLAGAIARYQQEQRDREWAIQLQDERLALLCQVRRALSSPVAMASLTIDRLRQQKPSGAQLEASLARIERSLANIDRVLEDFREQLYRESAQQQLRLQTLTPEFLQKSFCSAVVNELWEQAIAKTCPIVTCCEYTTTAIVLDLRLVRIILHNLLSNAIQYSAPGQTVRLHVQATPQTVQFQVGDRGANLSPEFMNQLLKLFGQGSTEEDLPEDSIGLLSVKAAVEKHQGTIAVENALNEGTTFTVTLPNFAPEENSTPGGPQWESLFSEFKPDFRNETSCC
ncbi:MAG: hybrid sensor histidine kinase/response regulator [Pseudanabaenaceae cyanobacterium]